MSKVKYSTLFAAHNRIQKDRKKAMAFLQKISEEVERRKRLVRFQRIASAFACTVCLGAFGFLGYAIFWIFAK